MSLSALAARSSDRGPTHVASSACGSFVTVSYQDGSVEFFDVAHLAASTPDTSDAVRGDGCSTLEPMPLPRYASSAEDKTALEAATGEPCVVPRALQLPAPVSDMCFLPYAQREYAVVLTTCTGQPVVLWDVTGRRRGAYATLNEMDTPVSAQSVTFTDDCQRIVAGMRHAPQIQVFDVMRTGRECVRSYKSRRYRGMVSAVDSAGDLVAFGLTGHAVELMDQRAGKHVGGALLHSGGVSRVRLRPPYLLTGARGRDGEIHVWDIRNMAARPLACLARDVANNQRVDFITVSEDVVSASHAGHLLSYSGVLSECAQERAPPADDIPRNSNSKDTQPVVHELLPNEGYSPDGGAHGLALLSVDAQRRAVVAMTTGSRRFEIPTGTRPLAAGVGSCKRVRAQLPAMSDDELETDAPHLIASRNHSYGAHGPGEFRGSLVITRLQL